jgi:hypothetical protein
MGVYIICGIKVCEVITYVLVAFVYYLRIKYNNVECIIKIILYFNQCLRFKIIVLIYVITG